MPVFQLREDRTPERALLVASGAATEPLVAELERRGVDVDRPTDIEDLRRYLAGGSHEAVLIGLEAGPQVTRLLMRLIRMARGAAPGLILLVDPSARHDLSGLHEDADEMISTALSPSRIVDATGLGLRRMFHCEAAA